MPFGILTRQLGVIMEKSFTLERPEARRLQIRICPLVALKTYDYLSDCICLLYLMQCNINSGFDCDIKKVKDEKIERTASSLS